MIVNRLLNFRRTWLAIGGMLVLLTIVGSLMPSVPDVSVSLSDKFLHVFAYAVLGSWFAAILDSRWRLIAALLTLGAVLEVVQMAGGVRQGELLDMLANSFGTLLGVLLVGRFVAKPILKFVDRTLYDLIAVGK